MTITASKNVTKNTELYFSPSGEAIWHALKEECPVALFLFFHMASAMDINSNIFIYRQDFTYAFYNKYLQKYQLVNNDSIIKTLRYLVANSIIGISKSIQHARRKTVVMPELRGTDNDQNMSLIMINPNLASLGRLPPFNYPVNEKLVFMDTDLEAGFRGHFKENVVTENNRVRVFSVTANPLHTTTPQPTNNTLH